MSKLKRIQKVLMLLITIFTIILVGGSIVKAKTAGYPDTIYLGYENNPKNGALLYSKDFYCANLGAGFGSNEELKKSSIKTYRSFGGDEGILAYILYEGEKSGLGGYNEYSPYQVAVWEYLYHIEGTGVNDPCSYSGVSQEQREKGKVIYEAAVNASRAAEKNTTSNEASVKLSDFHMRDVNESEQQGSFNISNLKGDIKKLTIEWDKGKPLIIEEGTIIGTKEFAIKNNIIFRNENNKWFTSVNGFSKDKNGNTTNQNTIYIINTKKDGEKFVNIKSISIEVENKSSGYEVEVTRWTNTDTEWKQDVMSAEVKKYEEEKKATATTTSFYDKTLKFIKKDKDSGETLQGAQFMIYVQRTGNANSNSGWLNNGNPIKAESGEIEIEIEEGTYYVYEVLAPEGYDLNEKQNGYKGVWYHNPNDKEHSTSVNALDKPSFPGAQEVSDNYSDWVFNGTVITKKETVGDKSEIKVDKELSLLKCNDDTNTCTVDIYNELTDSSLTITKIDEKDADKQENEKKKLTGAKFILYYINTNKEESERKERDDWGWVVNDPTKKKIYSGLTEVCSKSLETQNTSGIYTIGDSGEIKLEHLRAGTYYVYEIQAPKDYDLSKQNGYPKDDDILNGNIDMTEKTEETRKLLEKYGEGYKDLSKWYKNNKEKMPYGWAYCGSVEVTNDPTPENTDPKPYEQNEMDNRILVSLNAEIEVKNKKDDEKKVNLQGFVWEDVAPNKDYNYNYIYDKNDILLEGIPVYLRRIGASKEESLIAETTTKNIDGKIEYLFEDLNEKDVENAYVEFGYDNTKYVVVDYNVGEDNKINSKAQEQLMEQKELDDSNLTGINGNCPGRAVTMQKPKALMLARETDEKTQKDTYKYINLGLIPKMEHTFNVKEEISKVTVKLNNFDYSYPMSYDNNIDTEIASEYVPKVSDHYQDFYMYPAEATYTGKLLVSESEAKANKEGLQVLVQYDIQIFNNTPESKNIDVGREAKLFLSKLENHYDKNRYELVGDGWSDPGKTGVAVYNLNDNNLDKGIGKNQNQPGGTTTITFKVKPKAIAKLLTNQPDEADVEESPTKTYATAYHEYLRTDNVWDHNSSIKAYDENSAQETSKIKKYKAELGIADNEICYLHKSKPIEEKSGALYFGLKLGADRVISGTVFEDEAKTENKKYLGNGILDSKENRVKAVQVDLMYYGEDGLTVAKLQKYDNNPNIDNKERYKEETASIKTNELGEYKFEGVMPGNYFLRFTYGDGKQILCDSKGKELSEDIKKIYLRDYKSTIISKEDSAKSIKAATKVSDETQKGYIYTILTAKKDSEEYQKARTALSWYANIGNNYSIALDKLDQREQFDGYIYNKGVEDEKYFYADGEKDSEGHPYRTTINADSPFIYVSIENDNNIKDERNIAYKSDKNNTKLMRNENNEEVEFIVNKEQVTYHNKEYGGFNFGIVKQPKTKVTLEKKITNIVFMNSGIQITAGNPKDGPKYISDVDKATKGGSNNVNIEMEESLAYGAELIPTYEITLKNESDYDYIENDKDHYGDYYKYGDITKGITELKDVTIHEIVDNIDSKYDLDSKDYPLPEGMKKEGNKITIVGLEGKPVGTIKIGSESNPISYTVKSNSISLEDSLFKNTAELTKISLSNLTVLQKGFEWPSSSTQINISAPTGANRSYTYVIAGAISLIVIAVGIVIVKKKVL